MPQAQMLDPAASLTACLGALLRRLRTAHGLTQSDLGRLAGYDGSYVGAVERAAVRPSRELVARCDRALDAAGNQSRSSPTLVVTRPSPDPTDTPTPASLPARSISSVYGQKNTVVQ